MEHTQQKTGGFTLIETMVAISLLMLALIAPMSLAAQALTSAYFSRDQITAYYLAQEGIETVRAVRDANIIELAHGTSIDTFSGIPIAEPFTADALRASSNALFVCEPGGCPPLQTYGSLYSYSACEPSGGNGGTWGTTNCGSGSGWVSTQFDRKILACYIQTGGSSNGSCTSTVSDELRIEVTVSWQEGTLSQNFTINEDLYRWVADGT